MKRAWKKFSLLISVIAAVAVASPVAPPKDSSRVNELTLAGVRPGRDKINAPKKKFRELDRDETAKDAYVWGDICTHRDLRIKVDANHVVRTVTVSSSYELDIMAKCLATVTSPERVKMLQSGHGLQLDDACTRVTEIYGKPDSEITSVKGTEQLQLYFYNFGWAGSDVPQVMEVSCSQATGRIAKIMLAASSL